MNALARQQPTKHQFTYAQARRGWGAGVFPEYPKMELISGELFHMSADGPLAVDRNVAIAEWLFAKLAGRYDAPRAVSRSETLEALLIEGLARRLDALPVAAP